LASDDPDGSEEKTGAVLSKNGIEYSAFTKFEELLTQPIKSNVPVTHLLHGKSVRQSVSKTASHLVSQSVTYGDTNAKYTRILAEILKEKEA